MNAFEGFPLEDGKIYLVLYGFRSLPFVHGALATKEQITKRAEYLDIHSIQEISVDLPDGKTLGKPYA